jgi:hypothetical protein
VDTAPAPVGTTTDAAELRRLKWEAKQLDGTRPLGARELYRALNDAIDEGQDHFDHSNRDARLAMILMGGLNAALVIFASQSDLRSLTPLQRQVEFAVIALYALVAIVFLLQAIDTLRPGHYKPNYSRWPDAREDHPKGLRYFEDVVQRDTEEHWKAWKEVSLQQLNAELAVQLHSLCLKNHARKIALRQLYRSLRIMAIVFSAIIILFAAFTLT